MAAGRPLRIDAELDIGFLRNLDQLQAIASNWWPQMATIPIEPIGFRHLPPGRGAAMFFTAGVDSFFTLKRNLDVVEKLINVSGFDITLADTVRLQANRAQIDAVGRELGKATVHIATNLRENAYFASLDWGEFTHISAIASIAHSLAPSIGQIFVASSDVPPPWGSHQDMDPLWGSSAVSLVCDGWQFSRLEKVREIVDWDIVHRSLKVCWENREAALNCGYCEKCVRTQMAFLCAGATRLPETFPPGSLVERIEMLPIVSGPLLKQWKEIHAILPDGSMKDAVDGLLQRSQARQGDPVLVSLSPATGASVAETRTADGSIADLAEIGIFKALDDLTEQLGALIGDRPVALLDWPSYQNAGDHFIWLGEKVLLRARLQCNVIYEADLRSFDFFTFDQLPEETVILFQGGGNFGDLYSHHQRHREAIIAAYPGRRIILLPQSIHYETEEGLLRTRALLRGHPDLHLFVRDHESLRLTREGLGLDQVRLGIDSAFFLTGIVRRLEATLPAPDRCLVALLRADSEALPHALGQALPRVDWSSAEDVAEGHDADAEAALHALQLEELFATRSDRISWRRFYRAVVMLAPGKLILTDRLHGHVLALMMGKSHILLNNRISKNLNFLNAWTAGSGLVNYIDSSQDSSVLLMLEKYELELQAKSRELQLRDDAVGALAAERDLARQERDDERARARAEQEQLSAAIATANSLREELAAGLAALQAELALTRQERDAAQRIGAQAHAELHIAMARGRDLDAQLIAVRASMVSYEEVAHLRRALVQAEADRAHVAALLASTSWRITAPLRWLGKIFR